MEINRNERLGILNKNYFSLKRSFTIVYFTIVLNKWSFVIGGKY